jgi:hypothetical protein
MIAPILILLYVGIVEIGNLLTINRRRRQSPRPPRTSRHN